MLKQNHDLVTSDLDYSSDDDDDDDDDGDDDDDDDDDEDDIDTTAEFDCLPQEPLVTAEEVISEIEEMLEVSSTVVILNIYFKNTII